MNSKQPGSVHPVAGARILVTGGAGFVGSHVVDQLLDARAGKVVVVDNFISGARANLARHAGDRRLRVIEADVRNVEAMVAATRGMDYAVHFASLPFDHSLASPRECFEVMIDGFVNLLEAAVDARVKKLVIASCASVYGHPAYRPIDEDHPLRAEDAFAAAKIAAEEIGRAYHTMYGLGCVSLRYFRVYGSRMTARVWPEAPGAAATSSSPDSLASADLVSVADAARAAILALEAPFESRVFNIAAGTDGAIERARVDLGWKPNITLAAGLDDLAAAVSAPLPPEGASAGQVAAAIANASAGAEHDAATS